MPAATRSGQPARQKRSIQGVICGEIFGADGQRPERVGQPARQLAQHVRGGERHDVGEGEGPGIAAAGFLGDAVAVDEHDLAAGFRELVGGGDADDAGADDDDIGGHGLNKSRAG